MEVRRSVEQRASRLVAWLAVFALPLLAVGPWLGPWDTLGFHDWDAMEAHRELVRRSLLVHGELPFWNPYACGGFPAWGYVEGATTLVSPAALFYLALPMSIAVRLEVLTFAWIGAVGAFVAARKLTRHDAARLVVVALFAVNGRWGLQTAAGHTWHLAYAFTPWCFWALERARAPRGGVAAHAVLGALLAMMLYTGGIYPLPHTVLLLLVTAAGASVLERTWRPLVSLAVGGAVALGLAAPKLVPMLGTFARAPRAIASTERYDARALWAALTSRQQGFFDRPAPIRPYGWHEWGAYVGVGGVAAIVVGLVIGVGLRRDRRAAALALSGAVLFALAIGAAAPWAPWTWVHAHVPFFGSMHVPSRFLYPATLALALAAAPGLGALFVRARRLVGQAWVGPLLAAFVAGLGVDVALVARKPMAQAMWMVPPSIEPGPFRHVLDPPHAYRRPDWAGPMYLAMLGNTGVLRCYGAPPFEPRGAGVATTADGLVAIAAPGAELGGQGAADPGAATVVRWSPNGVTVDVRGATEGATLVYDMNADPGWSAEIVGHGGDVARARALDVGGRVAATLPAGDARVTFRYRPVGLGAGVAWLTLTAAALGLARFVERRRAS